MIDAARKPGIHASISVEDAVDWAEEHLFERRSIVSEHEIWRHALSRGRGRSFSIEANGRLRKVRHADLDRLTICRPNELTVGKGDRLQIKANAPSADGRKLANGEIVTVAKFAANGALKLEDGRIIPPTSNVPETAPSHSMYSNNPPATACATNSSSA